MELIDFKSFKEKKTSDQSLNEMAWKSSIMALIKKADDNSKRAFYQPFVADMYKKFNVSIDQIEDSAFKEIPPSDYFNKDPYNKLANVDKYLAIFINDDAHLAQEAKDGIQDLSRKLAEVEAEVDPKTGKPKATKGQIEFIKAQIDMLKDLKSPFLVAVAMGIRVIYYGFMPEDYWRKSPAADQPPSSKTAGMSFKTPHQVFRYGVHPAPWLMMRYFGLDDDSNKIVKSTGENIAERSTKCYVVDLEALQANYDMGTKLGDRAAAKTLSPHFKDEQTLRMENAKNYLFRSKADIDPISILTTFKDTVQRYMKYYAEQIEVIDEKSFNLFMNVDTKIEPSKSNEASVIGMSKVFLEFDNVLTEYFRIYKDYLNFLKSNEIYAKDVADRPKDYLKTRSLSKISPDIQRLNFDKILTDYMLELKKIKDRADKIADSLTGVGIIAKKPKGKVFNS